MNVRAKVVKIIIMISIIASTLFSVTCNSQPIERRKFEVVAMIEVHEYANAIAANDNVVCVACFGLGRVILIDPKINETTLVSPYVGAFFITVGEGIAWFTNIDGIDGDYMTKVDWDKEKVEQIEVGQYAGPITYGEGSVWVVVGNKVLRIDSQNNETIEVIEADIGYINDIVVGNSVVWLIEKSTGSVYRINTLNNQLLSNRIKVGKVPIGGACGEGSLWVTNSEDSSVSRISYKTNQVTNTIKVGNSPSSITVGGGLIWVANNKINKVSVIDPRLNKVINEIDVDGMIIDITFGDGSVWILYRAEDNIGKVLRINP